MWNKNANTQTHWGICTHTALPLLLGARVHKDMPLQHSFHNTKTQTQIAKLWFSRDSSEKWDQPHHEAIGYIWLKQFLRHFYFVDTSNYHVACARKDISRVPGRAHWCECVSWCWSFLCGGDTPSFQWIWWIEINHRAVRADENYLWNSNVAINCSCSFIHSIKMTASFINTFLSLDFPQKAQPSKHFHGIRLL